ncbi:MAG: hypothetical protein SaNoV_gp1 [Sanya Nora-like virus]|nr:MAG: hypothetical protein SaNoV_gp1 [Sanya Nora-like virus]
MNKTPPVITSDSNPTRIKVVYESPDERRQKNLLKTQKVKEKFAATRAEIRARASLAEQKRKQILAKRKRVEALAHKNVYQGKQKVRQEPSKCLVVDDPSHKIITTKPMHQKQPKERHQPERKPGGAADRRALRTIGYFNLAGQRVKKTQKVEQPQVDEWHNLRLTKEQEAERDELLAKMLDSYIFDLVDSVFDEIEFPKTSLKLKPTIPRIKPMPTHETETPILTINENEPLNAEEKDSTMSAQQATTSAQTEAFGATALALGQPKEEVVVSPQQEEATAQPMQLVSISTQTESRARNVSTQTDTQDFDLERLRSELESKTAALDHLRVAFKAKVEELASIKAMQDTILASAAEFSDFIDTDSVSAPDECGAVMLSIGDSTDLHKVKEGEAFKYPPPQQAKVQIHELYEAKVYEANPSEPSVLAAEAAKPASDIKTLDTSAGDAIHMAAMRSRASILANAMNMRKKAFFNERNIVHFEPALNTTSEKAKMKREVQQLVTEAKKVAVATSSNVKVVLDPVHGTSMEKTIPPAKPKREKSFLKSALNALTFAKNDGAKVNKEHVEKAVASTIKKETTFADKANELEQPAQVISIVAVRKEAMVKAEKKRKQVKMMRGRANYPGLTDGQWVWLSAQKLDQEQLELAIKKLYKGIYFKRYNEYLNAWRAVSKGTCPGLDGAKVGWELIDKQPIKDIYAVIQLWSKEVNACISQAKAKPAAPKAVAKPKAQ